MDSENMDGDLLCHPLVPVANETDARTTALGLDAFSPDRVTVLHVVEKGEGVPDKRPVEQSEQLAAESYAAFHAVFPDAEERITYARDVVGAIFEVAEEVGASAIVYRPRGGNRFVRFLSGDLSLKLLTNADRPVIALPRDRPDE